jgi:LPXTG-motif cell wall-anchored protein
VTPSTGLASTGSDAAGALAAASLLLIAGLGLAIRRRVRA